MQVRPHLVHAWPPRPLTTPPRTWFRCPVWPDQKQWKIRERSRGLRHKATRPGQGPASPRRRMRECVEGGVAGLVMPHALCARTPLPVRTPARRALPRPTPPRVTGDPSDAQGRDAMGDVNAPRSPFPAASSLVKPLKRCLAPTALVFLHLLISNKSRICVCSRFGESLGPAAVPTARRYFPPGRRQQGF